MDLRTIRFLVAASWLVIFVAFLAPPIYHFFERKFNLKVSMMLYYNPILYAFDPPVIFLTKRSWLEKMGIHFILGLFWSVGCFGGLYISSLVVSYFLQ